MPGWWERRQQRAKQRELRAAERARYEHFVDRVPAGLPLLCGRVVGVDVAPDQVRAHIERDCTPTREGGPCCVDLARRP
jgi:hypothetical protein